MALEMLVGLQVDDDKKYDKYRHEMMPILTELGGEFGYDMIVEKTLMNESGKPMNRVFTIRFPSREIMNQFFGNPTYLKIREKFFEPAVSSVEIISEYERD